MDKSGLIKAHKFSLIAVLTAIIVGCARLAEPPAPRSAETKSTSFDEILSGSAQDAHAVKETGAESDDAPGVPHESTYEQHMRERAETAFRPAPQPAGAAVDASNPLCLQLNFDVTNKYFYHGILQQDKGAILQPAAKLTYNLLQRDDFQIDAILATWNSLSTSKVAHDGDATDYWYEADIKAGLALRTGHLMVSATYTFLTSPADAFDRVQEFDLLLAYDDRHLLGKFALQPHALLGVETGANASDGRDKGVYLELGIAPGFNVDVCDSQVAITFPVAVGLSLDNYYQNAAGDDDTFGFLQVGAKASVPLPFDNGCGRWTLNAGVSAIFLGDNAAAFNHGDDEDFIASIGLQWNF